MGGIEKPGVLNFHCLFSTHNRAPQNIFQILKV